MVLYVYMCLRNGTHVIFTLKLERIRYGDKLNAQHVYYAGYFTAYLFLLGWMTISFFSFEQIHQSNYILMCLCISPNDFC